MPTEESPHGDTRRREGGTWKPRTEGSKEIEPADSLILDFKPPRTARKSRSVATRPHPIREKRGWLAIKDPRSPGPLPPPPGCPVKFQAGEGSSPVGAGERGGEESSGTDSLQQTCVCCLLAGRSLEMAALANDYSFRQSGYLFWLFFPERSAARGR